MCVDVVELMTVVSLLLRSVEKNFADLKCMWVRGRGMVVLVVVDGRWPIYMVQDTIAAT